MVKIRQTGIADNVEFGNNVTVMTPVNLYGCTIGDETFIGPFVEIQSEVRIGKRCRIQSHAFICSLVSIGDDCVISHGAKFVNDTFANNGPARGKKNLWKPTVLGNNVSIGTNATLLPVTICDNVIIGAGSVVTKDINEPGYYCGNPARLLRPLSEEGGA
jgi:acetyltransferase-like isoleucine patch superfamily enzyme